MLISFFTGSVVPNQSLFKITAIDHDLTFRPVFNADISTLFGNNTALLEKAIASCGGIENTQCLFDAAQTGDTETATQGQQELNTFETEKKELGMFLRLLFFVH